MPTGVQHAHTQWTLGWVCGQRGDDREAIEHVTRALGAFRAVALPDWEAEALSAVECFAAGDYDKARIHCNAALALFPVHAGPDARAGVLDSLGHIEHHSGHPGRPSPTTTRPSTGTTPPATPADPPTPSAGSGSRTRPSPNTSWRARRGVRRSRRSGSKAARRRPTGYSSDWTCCAARALAGHVDRSGWLSPAIAEHRPAPPHPGTPMLSSPGRMIHRTAPGVPGNDP